MATAKQLAWRKKFAALAKAGALKKAPAKKAARKKAPAKKTAALLAPVRKTSRAKNPVAPRAVISPWVIYQRVDRANEKTLTLVCRCDNEFNAKRLASLLRANAQPDVRFLVCSRTEWDKLK